MVALGRAAAVCAAVILVFTGCSSGTAELEEELAQVTAERDALQARIDAEAIRYELVVQKKEEYQAVIRDHEWYGSPSEVAEKLSTFATEDAQMDNDVFGATGIRSAWFYTLYGETQAEIDTIQQWVDPDGSQGGALSIWQGTNSAGYPFALIGIAIDTYNDDGLVTHEWIAYPYDDYVLEAIYGNGTETDVYGVPWGEGEQ